MNFYERMGDAAAALLDCAKEMDAVMDRQNNLISRVAQLETELHAIQDREKRIAKIFQESLTNGY